VFELDDSRVHLSHQQVFRAASWCTAVFAGNLAMFLRAAQRGDDATAAWMPVLLYAAVPAAGRSTCPTLKLLCLLHASV